MEFNRVDVQQLLCFKLTFLTFHKIESLENGLCARITELSNIAMSIRNDMNKCCKPENLCD